MKIIIPGGSGQVGNVLARHFHDHGHEVVVLSRQPRTAPWRNVFWDAETHGDWAAEFERADAVINLAGRSVNCRYHARNRREIMESRVKSVRAVGAAIEACRQPPRAWLQMSTATIYAHRYDAANDEVTGILGGNEPQLPDTWRFSLDVARAWEQSCDDVETPHTRKLKLRLAMLMNVDRGGTFDLLLSLVRHGLGGQAGDGRQYMSWIHEQDFVRAIQWLIEHREISGVVNIAAPNPLPNADFMRGIAHRLGHATRTAGRRVDVGNWHAPDAHRIGIDPEKPKSRVAPAVGGGLYVRLPDLARAGARAVRALESTQPLPT